MQEQFVKYEIALKLKELGFDEECFGYYSKCYDGSFYLNIYQDYDVWEVKRLEAPLWQQAIDFVFKKLDFYYPMLSFKVFSDGSGEWYNPKDEGYNSLEINFDNKEEMILKAIEIIKNK